MSSITFSFIPDEIIAPGTIIGLRTPRDVDPESARGAVRLFQSGNQVPIIVAVERNVIEFSTENLSPATYKISVGKLLDTDGRLLTEPTTSCVIVGCLKGTIPNGFRAIHAVYLAVGDTSTTRLSPGEPAPEGTTYVEIVKAVNVETKKSVDFAFDAEGNKVDGAGLLAEVDARRSAKFGRIDQTLWNHLQDSVNTDIINIIVWPKIDHGPIDYEKPSDRRTKGPPPAERERLRVIQRQKGKVVDILNDLGATVVGGPSSIPSVSASLKAEDVYKLVDFDDVGLVLYDDRSVVLDFQDSITITRLDLPQSRGINGTGVHVAVFEDGPSDITDLVYAGRFKHNPAASPHARLTSAIIKNVEPCKPHGYAPDCELYSANSYDNSALHWAIDRECTVISQSFHRRSEETMPILSSDDILKDFIANQYPYPTIVQAAGDATRCVVHKGFNTLTVGNHNDDAAAMGAMSVKPNPSSSHSDRELPELCANGTGVTAVGLTMSGTSFSAPAVAATVALLQHADNDGILKSWPEGCRAILLASAGRSSTWWGSHGVVNGLDACDVAGTVDADMGVKIAQQRKARGAPASVCGWDVGTLMTADFDEDNHATFHYSVHVPGRARVVKVALAWGSKVGTDQSGVLASSLTVDLDLWVMDSDGNVAGISASHDNSYEVVEFLGAANQTYEINIRRWAGTENVRYGVAWTTFDNAPSKAVLGQT